MAALEGLLLHPPVVLSCCLEASFHTATSQVVAASPDVEPAIVDSASNLCFHPRRDELQDTSSWGCLERMCMVISLLMLFMHQALLQVCHGQAAKLSSSSLQLTVPSKSELLSLLLTSHSCGLRRWRYSKIQQSCW